MAIEKFTSWKLYFEEIHNTLLHVSKDVVTLNEGDIANK